MSKNSIKPSSIVALGAGAVALAASTYYFFGPMGKIHRKKAAGWMIKMKGEIIEKIEEAGEVSEEVYKGIVDTVLASYLATGKVATPELQAFADILKGQWKNIVKTLPKNKHVKKAVKKAKEIVS
ncbi:MAG: hypothetical protein WCT02_04900 [Candidatus Paceibacterota bacterium]